jgi:hypothetical protein
MALQPSSSLGLLRHIPPFVPVLHLVKLTYIHLIQSQIMRCSFPPRRLYAFMAEWLGT